MNPSMADPVSKSGKEELLSATTLGAVWVGVKRRIFDGAEPFFSAHLDPYIFPVDHLQKRAQKAHLGSSH